MPPPLPPLSIDSAWPKRRILHKYSSELSWERRRRQRLRPRNTRIFICMLPRRANIVSHSLIRSHWRRLPRPSSYHPRTRTRKWADACNVCRLCAGIGMFLQPKRLAVTHASLCVPAVPLKRTKYGNKPAPPRARVSLVAIEMKYIKGTQIKCVSFTRSANKHASVFTLSQR